MDWRGLLGVALVGWTVACGTDDNRSSPPAGDGGTIDADPPADSSFDGSHDAGVLTGPCEGNARRECSYNLPESFGVAGCFIGAQACVGGMWGPCVKAEWLPSVIDGGAADAADGGDGDGDATTDAAQD